jgi:2',3'-cyclic-nucleotide 2'-phosphodiesterase (5'-nucleotidase family)
LEGDLHDGAGLSDVTTPDAAITNILFEKIDYDLLTIGRFIHQYAIFLDYSADHYKGNHELYLAEVAYQTFTQLSKFWGDKYLTSNVQILNNATNEWEYIGQQYKYFTTANGVRIMAFGVLFDFTGNVNISQVTPAEDLVTEQWFLDAVNYTEPVDLFVVLGHNPARVGDDTGSTFGTIHDAIRSVHASTPIQFFGGHSHIRDFAVLDESSTSIESGRYCETLGWLSMSGFSKCSSGWKGKANPQGVSNPSRKATTNSTSPYSYSRRYLDWNRATFDFHAVGGNATFDTASGENVTSAITTYREQLNLGQVYGCAPQSYCMSCAEFNSTDNIYPLLSEALATSVVNETRQDIPRYIIANTGSIRFDLYKGPFTYDDFFIVSPFVDIFMYVPEVPCSLASTVLDSLNNAGANEKRSLGYMPVLQERDICVNPTTSPLVSRDMEAHVHVNSAITRRQVVDLVAGYTTTDDFGTDGDDTAHSSIPYYEVPDFFQGEGGFGDEGCTDTADLIFLDL